MKLRVQDYYETLESRLGYLLFLKGSQHFGYYPSGRNTITEDEAQKAHHDLLVKILRCTPKDCILDAGCGQGFIACDIAKRYNLHITGIDITPYIISRAQNRAKREGIEDKTDFRLIDYSHTDFPDNSFDRIYAVESLCHAKDLSKTLSELYRVLKPGGRIVNVEYIIQNKKYFSPYQWNIFEMVMEETASPSLYCYRRGMFASYLEKAGFSDIKMLDISENFKPSLYRLSRFARYPYKLIKALGLQRRFINTTVGVEFYQMAEQNLFGYAVYSARK